MYVLSILQHFSRMQHCQRILPFFKAAQIGNYLLISTNLGLFQKALNAFSTRCRILLEFFIINSPRIQKAPVGFCTHFHFGFLLQRRHNQNQVSSRKYLWKRKPVPSDSEGSLSQRIPLRSRLLKMRHMTEHERISVPTNHLHVPPPLNKPGSFLRTIPQRTMRNQNIQMKTIHNPLQNRDEISEVYPTRRPPCNVTVHPYHRNTNFTVLLRVREPARLGQTPRRNHNPVVIIASNQKSLVT